jgi:hypothetical protein
LLGLGSYSVTCWYGPFPMAPLIQFGGFEFIAPGF